MGPVAPARRSTKAPRGERGRAKMQQHQASAITRRDPRPNHCGFLACALLRCFSRDTCVLYALVQSTIRPRSQSTHSNQQSAISNQMRSFQLSLGAAPCRHFGHGPVAQTHSPDRSHATSGRCGRTVLTTVRGVQLCSARVARFVSSNLQGARRRRLPALSGGLSSCVVSLAASGWPR